MESRRNVRSAAALALAGIVTVVLGSASDAVAQAQSSASLERISQLALPTPVGAVLDPSLLGQSGRVDVVLRLSEAHAGAAPRGAQRAQRDRVVQQQAGVLANVRALDPAARVLGQTRMVLNAVMVEVDASVLPSLAADVRVLAVDPVVNYRLDLAQTVPYIGARAVQNAGVNGTGVKVAVLDSGIDYTHAAFGGPGTLAAYQAAIGTSPSDPRAATRDGLFPTAKVVEGYDFVGEAWPNAALAPDPDPIDREGHGTHVADIIGGAGGVAPGVSLYAVKVCSAVSSSCSGVAILQGIEYSVDPNGDGDSSDAVDVINMSLGAPYGLNYDNSTAIAVDNATALGVLTVASAGNSADKPYITGTPAGARTALSVAQTEVPSSKVQILTLNSSAVSNRSIGGVFQPWAVPLAGTISAPVVYDTTNSGTRLGCSNAGGANPWVGTPLAGKIVIVDRGTCSFSLKIANIAAAGGVAGIIALVDQSLPFTGAFGGGAQTIPAWMIRLVDGNLIKAQIPNGATLTLDPSNQLSTVGTVVGSSSRGPASGLMRYDGKTIYGQLVKPEIGAPGASVSAIAGSGTGTEAFGGTSGAAPMVAGSAALLVDATDGALSPLELKARLTNTADERVFNTPSIFGGALAPISRIGGGEVRANRAVAARAAAWDSDTFSGAISFGTVEADKATTVSRRITVRNYGTEPVSFAIEPEFRYADDEATGAISVSAPAGVTVPAGTSRDLTIRVTVDPGKLRPFVANSGAQGGVADALTLAEFDGYLKFTDTSGNAANDIHMPWHVLPRAAANVNGPNNAVLGGSANFANVGAATAQVEWYSLLGTSPMSGVGAPGEGAPPIDLKAAGFRTFSGAGVCPNNTYLLQFAVANHYRQSHANVPASVRVNLDTNRDGTPDFQVRSADFTLNQISDGRNLAWVINLRTGAANALFFTDHALNSGNFVLTVCGSQLADLTRPGGPLPVPALGQLINASVELVDIYFTGLVRDSIGGLTFAPGGERFQATIGDIPSKGTGRLAVAPGASLPTSDAGILLMLDAVRGGAKNGNPDGKEALVVTVR